MAFRPWDNLGLKLLALGLAVVLWFVVLGEQRTERVVSARVEFRDVPRGLVVASRTDGGILLKLQGPKRVLADLELDEVIVSLGARDLREGQALLPLSPSEIRGLPRGVEVVEVSPRSLRLRLEARLERVVEVAPRIEGTPGLVRRAVAEPRTVRVEGPRTEVRALARAFTLPVNVDGRTEGFAARTALEPADGQVRFVDEAPIRVSVDIGPQPPG
jgi:hypothetical protein